MIRHENSVSRRRVAIGTGDDKGQTFQLQPCRVTPQRVKLILSTSQKDSPYPTAPLRIDSGHANLFRFFPGYSRDPARNMLTFRNIYF